ncbi:MAG: prolipoprotein diacylglyceryl transferase [Termitinemataceae bacterium]|nr:MAG: prolipoprotein diacylglyceryl transferase [Termitinemataceae bacterium]
MLLSINFPSWLNPEVIPGLPFRWYGLMYLVAFSIAFLMTRKQIRQRRFPMTEDDLSAMFFCSILGLLLGARIFSTIVYETSNLYRLNPWLIFWPFRNGHFTGLQGMSYHGGVIGCITGAVLWSIKNKKDFREILDMLSAAIPLGYTFGRLGNFINGELYGRVTTVPWGMIFNNAEPLPASQTWVKEIAEQVGIEIQKGTTMVNLPRHPSQLYEALLEGVVLWAIVYLLRNKKPFKGFITCMYIGGYGFIRFFIEYFREPDSELQYKIELVKTNLPIAYVHPLTSFSTGQVFCFIMIVIAITGLLLLPHLPNPKPIIFYPKETESEQNTNTASEKKQYRSQQTKKITEKVTVM